jgi:hypothetical protein
LPWCKSGSRNCRGRPGGRSKNGSLSRIDTGGFEKKDRITRRIEVRSKADIDDELKKWLKKAYEMDE